MHHGLIGKGDIFRQEQEGDHPFVAISSSEGDTLPVPVWRTVFVGFYACVQGRSIVRIQSGINLKNGIRNRFCVAVIDALEADAGEKGFREGFGLKGSYEPESIAFRAIEG